MIDAGSSRSNVYLYEWPGEKENETGVVTEIMNCRVTGESLAQDEHISTLTELVTQDILEKKLPPTPSVESKTQQRTNYTFEYVI